MVTPNPSLNDILKPILEAKGWKYNGWPIPAEGALYVLRSYTWCKDISNNAQIQLNIEDDKVNVYTSAYELTVEDMQSIWSGVDVKPRKADLVFEASDPQFFQKLDKWLEE